MSCFCFRSRRRRRHQTLLKSLCVRVFSLMSCRVVPSPPRICHVHDRTDTPSPLRVGPGLQAWGSKTSYSVHTSQINQNTITKTSPHITTQRFPPARSPHPKSQRPKHRPPTQIPQSRLWPLLPLAANPILLNPAPTPGRSAAAAASCQPSQGPRHVHIPIPILPLLPLP